MSSKTGSFREIAVHDTDMNGYGMDTPWGTLLMMEFDGTFTVTLYGHDIHNPNPEREYDFTNVDAADAFALDVLRICKGRLGLGNRHEVDALYRTVTA